MEKLDALALAEMATDLDFEDSVIEEVEGGGDKPFAIKHRGGWWYANVPADSPVVPEVGMKARFFPAGIGHEIYGLHIDGTPIFYKTRIQREAEREAWKADYEERRRKIALESKLPEKQIEGFEWTDDMDEISGFGGGYERTCRAMVSAGCAFLAAHPDLDPQFHGFKGIYGVIAEDNDAAKQLSKVVLDASNGDCSGAMHQASIGHVLAWKRMGSWEAYQAEMRKPRDEAAE